MTIQFQDTHHPQVKATVLSDRSLRLHGDPVEGNQAGRYPYCYLSVVQRDNEVLLRGNLNNGKRGDEGSFKIPFNPLDFAAFMVMLEDVLRSNDKITKIMEIKRSQFSQSERKFVPVSQGTIAVGRDADGLEFIGIRKKGLPALKFRFTPAELVTHINSTTMEPCTRNEVSTTYARAFLKYMSLIVPVLGAHLWRYDATNEARYIEKRNKDNGNGGGNNNYNNGGYNNGGGNNRSNDGDSNPDQSSASFDDIPF
nr:MAG TPA: hypothetical protein [Caudoviricetes sp.]